MDEDPASIKNLAAQPLIPLGGSHKWSLTITCPNSLGQIIVEYPNPYQIGIGSSSINQIIIGVSPFQMKWMHAIYFIVRI